jgi:hypothetical protein
MSPLFHCTCSYVKSLRSAAILVLAYSGLALTAPAVPEPPSPAAPVPPLAATQEAPAHSSTTSAFRVAILPFTGDEISLGMLSSVTKRFQSELESTHSYEIVKRRKLNKFLASRDPDAGPCLAMGCFQEVANQFGVQGVFTGVVSKGSETWRLQVKQIDVATGSVTFNHLVEVFGSNDGSLSENCEELAKIAGGLKVPESDYTVLDRSGHSVWPWVTGGILVAGGATAAAVLLLNDDGSSNTPKTEPSTSSPPEQLIVRW